MNLKKVLDIFLEKTPSNIDIDELKQHILSIKGVKDIHHIHIRSIDGYNSVGTFHIIVEKYSENVKDEIKEELEEHGIGHSTIEIELENEKCHDKDCEIKPSKVHHHHH